MASNKKTFIDFTEVRNNIEPFCKYEKKEQDTETGMTIGNVLVSKRMVLSLPNSSLQLTEKVIQATTDAITPNGDRYRYTRMGAVDVHLNGDVAPDQNGRLVGRIDVCLRTNEPTRSGTFPRDYLSVSVWPVGTPNETNMRIATATEVHIWGGDLSSCPTKFEWTTRIGPDHNKGNVFI